QIADYPCPAFVIKSLTVESDAELFGLLYQALPLLPGDTEPMMNIVAWRNESETVTVVLPRKKHRPDCYNAEGDNKLLVSPGALDMGGLIITPRQEDFHKMTTDKAVAILQEVALDENGAKEVV
ncbi:DUF4922 domain-containing protein, partial [Parabacteroides distasonis]